MAMGMIWNQCGEQDLHTAPELDCSLPWWAGSPKHYGGHDALLVSDVSTPGLLLLE